ncbi:hypothetical protein Taro_013795 [Colocasia esculenta]|uniref:S-adenosyl-L-methionine-dependent methyltransferase superfamily protein n=1 Tax=Colocasia esculenta TaxID=4460 RepID=A0A843UD24_COLES|nr:hypothetical protein [Colocasia esculenta]
MWRQGARAIRRSFRGYSAAARRQIEDEGDWRFAPEWWEPESGGLNVFQQHSSHGNGLVSVVAHPSSRPAPEQWPAIERSLQQRYVEIHPESDPSTQLSILGYQWRVLRFNNITRQSTAKVMAAYRKSDPGSLYVMQQPHCLAVPCKFLSLFVIRSASIHVLEIDPVVVSASIQAMGFPVCEVKDMSGGSFRLIDSPNQDLWQGIQERLCLYISDAEDFILGNDNLYDLVFIDAYDGDDIFPHKLWDPDGPFLKSLADRLHPDHGTAVVNLHADSDILAPETDYFHHFESILPMGKYVSQVCRAYKRHVGLAYKVSVPWLCNISLVACRRGGGGGRGLALSPDRNFLLNSLVAKSSLVESVLDLPFPCLQYIKTGFAFID